MWPSAYSEMEQVPWKPEDTPANKGHIKSLISAEWHYIEHETLGTELYRWTSDTQELENLADTEEGKGIIENFLTSP